MPPVVLTDFRLFGRSVSVGGDSPLRQSISTTASVKLSHSQSIFTFEFSALSFVYPQRNRYRYKLEGLEKDWNYADSNHRVATYTTLAPGRYVFRVEGSNHQGRWNEAGASIAVIILPPWWKTVWFEVLSLAVLLTILWAAYSFRVRGIQRLNTALEDRVRQRTAQLETANQDLAIANKDLEAFSYTVSHDLRAPLRHINSFSRMLLEESGKHLPQEATDLLERIDRGALRMAGLIDGLLSFSRLGRGELSLSDVALSDLVREVVDELSPDWSNHPVEWKIGSLPIVRGDPALLRQVFQNLISNALTFSRNRSPATIEIGETPQDGVHVIFIRDNGIGFDMKFADKLFGVFQRLHRREEFEGTGIGLATVQRIVQKHGGKIWAEAAPGAGATFFFTCR